MTQIFVKYPGSNWQELNTIDNLPIKLSFQVADIEDPTKVASTFSRTFRVPNTEQNGRFFKTAFSVNGTDYNPTLNVPCYIQEDGALIASGNMRLISILRDEKSRNFEYECLFVGETGDFASKVGSGFMNELDLSQYNHILTYSNVVNSWTNGLFNGDIVYPLIEWGYTYDSNNVPIQSTLSNGSGTNKSFTQNSHPLVPEQFKPAMRLKSLWDAIFSKAGYRYTSNSFMNSAFFRKLYVISDSTARAEVDSASTIQLSVGNIGNPFSQIYADNSLTLMQFPEVSLDPSNTWNPSTSTYTAPFLGTYQFQVAFDCTLTLTGTNPTPLSTSVRLIDADTSSILATQTFSVPTPPAAPQSYLLNFTGVNLNAGQRFRIFLQTNNIRLNVFTQIFNFININNQGITLNSFLPDNVKQIDFIKSVVDKFKLVFVPSKARTNEFEIIPWVQWIAQGDEKDWTNKLDENKELVITPIFYQQTRYQKFTDQTDSDYILDNYQKNFKEPVGELELDSQIELIQGESSISTVFAPLMLDKIGGTTTIANTFLVPHIAKDTLDPQNLLGQRQPIQPKMRLAFYNGLIASPHAWYLEDDLPTAVAFNSYPLMSNMFEWLPFGQSSQNVFDLNWENMPPFYNIDIYNNPPQRSNITAYTQYWRTWYTYVYDAFSRKVEAHLKLDWRDINNLKFNDKIWIKDAYYLVNKIIDYNASQRDITKVELYKVGNLGVSLNIEVFNSISLCFGSTVCDAFCCGTQDIYYVDGTDLADSTRIFADPIGNQPAPVGYYADGDGNVYQVDVNGFIISVSGEPVCECTGELQIFDTDYGDTRCNSFCIGSPSALYGSDPIFSNNTRFWADVLGTIVPTDGYYNDGGVIAYLEGGFVIFFSNSDGCNCTPTFFEQTLRYSTEDGCTACVSDTATYWTDQATIATSSFIYATSDGSIPAAAGFYSEGTNWYEVNSIGNIIQIGPCSSCA